MGQRKWKLLEQVRITNPYGLDFHIPAGYEWDGASAPIFRDPLLFASLPHDYIYDGKIPALSRKDADRIFMYYAKQDNVPAWFRWISYICLRTFAAMAEVIGMETESVKVRQNMLRNSIEQYRYEDGKRIFDPYWNTTNTKNGEIRNELGTRI